MIVGTRIAERRKERGLSQAKLAEEVGLSANVISLIERNRREPDADTLSAIASALGMTVVELDIAGRLDINDLQNRGASTPTLQPPGTTEEGLTTLLLTREEARIILFTRMNQHCMPFLQTYITSEQRKRDQLEKAWKLINQFQV